MISVETIRMPNGAVLAPTTFEERLECCSNGGIWTGEFTEVEEPKPLKPKGEEKAPNSGAATKKGVKKSKTEAGDGTQDPSTKADGEGDSEGESAVDGDGKDGDGKTEDGN